MPPTLTGSLGLILFQGTEPTARQSLDLKTGLHFRYLRAAWIQQDDLLWVNYLVVEYSDTLKNLEVMRYLHFAIFLASALKPMSHPQLKAVRYFLRPTS